MTFTLFADSVTGQSFHSFLPKLPTFNDIVSYANDFKVQFPLTALDQFEAFS